MNPLMSEALKAIFRWLFAICAGFFVSKGIWTDEAASIYVGAAAVGVVSLLWSLWDKYHSRLKLLSALLLEPGSTEHMASQLAKSPEAPSATTPKDETPQLTETKT
jgi:hypothetical protein